MATNYYSRVSTVLAAVALAAMVAMLVAYGTASAQIMPGATLTVNTLEDQTTPSPNDGKCSLREAIGNANNNNQSSSTDCLAGTAGDARDTINFAKGLSGKIALASELPAITDAEGLTIDGGKARIDVSGKKQVQLVSVDPGAQLTLKNLTVTEGFSSGSAGGIYNRGTLEVVNSTFSGNTGFQGGGIYNAGGTLAVTNSTFFGNGAEEGNDIINGGVLRVISSTFSGNTLNGGGIVNFGAEATLRNTIMADDPSGHNCVAYTGSPFTDGGYNISNDGSCNFDESTSRNNADPKLASGLANNGGPTQTIALLKDSPALNAIPKGQNGCATATDRVATDQRGVKRPQGTRCDIGAYEKKVKRH